MKIGKTITLKTIVSTLALDREYGNESTKVAKLIKQLCNQDLSPGEVVENPSSWLKVPSSLDRWLDEYKNPNQIQEAILELLDALIQGHGTEAEFGDDPFWPVLSWVNTGDTYSTTIVLYDHDFYIGTWGDWIESMGLNND